MKTSHVVSEVRTKALLVRWLGMFTVLVVSKDSSYPARGALGVSYKPPRYLYEDEANITQSVLLNV